MDHLRTPHDEIYVYAMTRPGFILQHVVDSTAVETATLDTKPITIVFGLVGLYLHVEMQLSGRQVQQLHMKLAKMKPQLPNLHLPENRGSITAVDVLAASPGLERDRAIEDWCKSVWSACTALRPTIVELCLKYQLV